ncbi:hypothetical protein F5887DRAFT_442783 [Amanita rubescens]|nr:hypothetical protein F5887DRAFT_442783 [Amanita rubescens]
MSSCNSVIYLIVLCTPGVSVSLERPLQSQDCARHGDDCRVGAELGGGAIAVPVILESSGAAEYTGGARSVALGEEANMALK